MDSIEMEIHNINTATSSTNNNNNNQDQSQQSQQSQQQHGQQQQKKISSSSQSNRLMNGMPKWFKEFSAELIGTFLLVMIGLNAVGNYKLNRDSKVGVDQFAVAFAFGIGGMAAISATQHISGAHLNPAVTLALVLVKKHPFKKLFHYFLGQYLGAFLAAFTVYLTYFEGLEAYDNGQRLAYFDADNINNNLLSSSSNLTTEATKIIMMDRITGGLFATYPAPWMSLFGSLLDETIATFTLVFCILAVTNENSKIPKYFQPFMIGMIICAMVISFGLNCGAALNPARDLSPRLFQLLIGYGWHAFRPIHSLYWLAAGVAGPHIGACIAALLYDYIVLYDQQNYDNI